MLFIAFFFLLMKGVQTGAGELLSLLEKTSTGKDEAPNAILQSSIWINEGITGMSVLIGVWVFRVFIDKKTVGSLGFAWHGFAGHAWTGFWSALAMVGAGTLVLMAFKYLSFTDAGFDIVSLISNLGLMLLVAFAEELLFRGYLLNNMMQSMDKWLALVISALLFVSVHLGNPNAQDSIIPMIEIFVGGIMLGVNYIYTKNLWFGIFLHFGWNFFMGPVLGYEVSGLNLKPILTQSLSGPNLWTGGSFGFEGSILSLILNMLLTASLVFFYERSPLKTSKMLYLKN